MHTIKDFLVFLLHLTIVNKNPVRQNTTPKWSTNTNIIKEYVFSILSANLQIKLFKKITLNQILYIQSIILNNAVRFLENYAENVSNKNCSSEDKKVPLICRHQIKIIDFY